VDDALVARGSVETRMRRGDYTRGLAQVLGEECCGEGPATAVKKEDRARGLDKLDRRADFSNFKHEWNCISTCLYTQADIVKPMTDQQATGRLLKRAQWRNHRSADRALATVGTSLAQWDALRAISKSPDSSAHDLAIATFQSDQAFGTLANRLEAQGL